MARILLSQYRPAIRLWKWAKTLQRMGHTIDIVHQGDYIRSLQWSEFRFVDRVRPADYRLHITFQTVVNSLTNLHPRLLVAVGDLKYMYPSKRDREDYCLHRALWSFYVSETQRRQACREYPHIKDQTSVIHNSLVPEQLPATLPSKLDNGKRNIVYAGTLSSDPMNHRFLVEEFAQIAELKDTELHVYPSEVADVRAYANTGAVLHDRVNPLELVGELAKYDYGLILWHGWRDIANSSLPNKVYEYRAAGLPVISGPYREILRFPGVHRIDRIEDILTIDAPPSQDVRLYGDQAAEIGAVIDALL